MKPNRITAMLDLAMAARKQGSIFNPCFEGEAGLGKSEIAQAWVAKQRLRNPEFGFIDLRIAYLEGQVYLEPHPKELMLRNAG